jgi:transcription termination/antitermination protein NusG
LYAEQVRWTDRTVLTERPLFSGYIFVRFTPQNRVAVISTPGVLRLLGDERWDIVHEEELAKIRLGLASGLPLRPYPTIPVGTHVCIRKGIFAGAEGVVTELRRQCKVAIALSATQHCFSLEVTLDELNVLDERTMKPTFGTTPAFGF